MGTTGQRGTDTIMAQGGQFPNPQTRQRNYYGQATVPQGQGAIGPRFDFQSRFFNPNAQTPGISPLTVSPQRTQMLQQMGAEQLGRQQRMSQQDLMRAYDTRGLGRSGLEMQAVAQQYGRGTGQQSADLNRQLLGDQMQMEFGEQQQARGLEAQRAGQQADRNLRSQQAQAEQNLGYGQMGTQAALGLGNLGIAERQQAMREFGAQNAYENPALALAPIYQSIASGAASNPGGGGKGK